MKHSDDFSDRLERFIGRTLREQPLRHAPATLEQRVLHAVQRRAAQPWWWNSFSHWPWAARAAFVLFAIAAVRVALAGASVAIGDLEFAAAFVSLSLEITWLRAVTDAFGVVGRSIPSIWLQGAIAAVIALYATLFGLSAAAYRTLYTSR